MARVIDGIALLPHGHARGIRLFVHGKISGCHGRASIDEKLELHLASAGGDSLGDNVEGTDIELRA